MILTAGVSLEVVTLRGNLIKQFREERGWSIERLAEESEVTPHEALSEIEDHVAFEAPQMVAVRLARALGVAVTAICADESYREEVPEDPRTIRIEGIH